MDSEVPKSSPEWPQNLFLVLMYHFTHNTRWSGTPAQSKNLSAGQRGVVTTSSFLPLGLADGRWNLKPSWSHSSTAHHGGSEPWLAFGVGPGDGSAPHSSALAQRGGLLSDVPSYILTAWTHRTFISLLFQCFGSFVVKVREFGF